MKDEIYFTISLTENEHFIVEDMITSFCGANNFILIYYRKFKTGHIPMWRECKIKGNVPQIQKFLADNHIGINNVNKKIHFKGQKMAKIEAHEFYGQTLK